MKQCRYCNKFFPEDQFGVALTTKDKVYRRHKCRTCYRKTKRVLLENHKQWVDDYKRSRPCSVCGISDPRVLDLHHQGDQKKEFSVSVGLAEKYGFNRIKKEIAKCVSLCANCHRILHYEEEKEKKKKRGVVQW